MGKVQLGVGVGLLYCLALPAQAKELDEDFWLDLALTASSDYRTGGICQSLGDPALWARASATHSSEPRKPAPAALPARFVEVKAHATGADPVANLS